MIGAVKASGAKVVVKRIKLKRSSVEHQSVDDPYGKKFYEKKVNGSSISRFKHANVTSLQLYFEQEDFICCVFEHGCKGDLLGVLKQNGAINLRLCQKYFSQIAQGVKCFHKLRIAHRHLSLENVLLQDNDVCQVMDFGLAMVRVFGMTNESDLMKSPEEIANQSYDPIAADIWALGLMLYSMLTGFNLLERATEEDERFKALMTLGSVEPLSRTDNATLPALVIDLLDGMLQIDPTKRWTIQQVTEHRFLSVGRGRVGRRLSVEAGSPVSPSTSKLIGTRISLSRPSGITLPKLLRRKTTCEPPPEVVERARAAIKRRSIVAAAPPPSSVNRRRSLVAAP